MNFGSLTELRQIAKKIANTLRRSGRIQSVGSGANDHKEQKPVAIFDIGTNSILLLVARQNSIKGRGSIHTLLDTLETPRPGENLDRFGKIQNQALDRTIRSLRKLIRQSAKFSPEKLIAVGTNVFRRAKNAEVAIEKIRRKTGLSVVTLTGEEEAALCYYGAFASLPHLRRGFERSPVVLDIGGGSTELATIRQAKLFARTVEIGAVRLTEWFSFAHRRRFRAKKSPNNLVVRYLQFVAESLPNLKSFNAKNRELIGAGGTITSLAALKMGLRKYDGEKVHGLDLSLAEIEGWLQVLARIDGKTRRKLMQFDSGRADIIVAGIAILVEIMKRLRADKIIVSNYGLRWGIARILFMINSDQKI